MGASVLVADRYRLDEPLGRGGMGEVWRATDQVLGRQVAVKLMLTAGADEKAAEDFRMEARTAACLNHPHVAAVYDFGAHDGRLYLVMELLDGHSLAQELATHGPLDPQRVADIAVQVAAGLAAAHREGVVHRDIKPSNLMLAADGTVKITDFGIARFTEEACSVTAGQVVGSSSYLAPERGLGRSAGPPCDAYSLGCVLYELLTGRPPFKGDNPTAVVYQHVHMPPAPPGRLRTGLPGALDDYLLRLLAKEPGRRPSVEQIAGWFAAWRTEQPRPPWPADARTKTSPSSTATPKPRPARGARATLNKALVGVVGAVVFAVSAAVGMTMNSDTDHPPSRQSEPSPALTGASSPSSTDSSASATPSPAASPATSRPASTSTSPSTEPTAHATGEPTAHPTASSEQTATPASTPPKKPARKKKGPKR
ncbi:serine/threonine-protein kinase [Streptomyces decoyicus]|uniref:serine/threonine-protein kinase n=1 Tax=Streptomyces decoyicus TaxID=249567 RepID=UPI002475AE43|nr:serine/threonine-protein kinase [Streptomyces decoyicus]